MYYIKLYIMTNKFNYRQEMREKSSFNENIEENAFNYKNILNKNRFEKLQILYDSYKVFDLLHGDDFDYNQTNKDFIKKNLFDNIINQSGTDIRNIFKQAVSDLTPDTAEARDDFRVSESSLIKLPEGVKKPEMARGPMDPSPSASPVSIAESSRLDDEDTGGYASKQTTRISNQKYLGEDGDTLSLLMLNQKKTYTELVTTKDLLDRMIGNMELTKSTYLKKETDSTRQNEKKTLSALITSRKNTLKSVETKIEEFLKIMDSEI